MPDRLQRKRTPGSHLPDGTVCVDRSTRWGNIFWPGQRVISPGAYGAEASPYHGCASAGVYGSGARAYQIRKVRDGAEAVALFADYVRHDPSGWPPGEIHYSLRGLDLACWCPLPAEGEPDICHASILLAIANSGEGESGG